MNNNYVSVGKAAKILGVSISTLQRWDREGKLVSERTPAGHRRYKLSAISVFNPLKINEEVLERETVAYARVSSRDQKKDLERQKKVLEMYCASKGWKYKIIDDLGSGMNYNKRGLINLLNDILDDKIGRLVITHKDRLLRFGTEIVFSVCDFKNVEVVIINQGDASKSYEQELAEDVLEIITVFSARMYGARSHKNKKLIEGMKEAVEDAKDTQDKT